MALDDFISALEKTCEELFESGAARDRGSAVRLREEIERVRSLGGRLVSMTTRHDPLQEALAELWSMEKDLNASLPLSERQWLRFERLLIQLTEAAPQKQNHYLSELTSLLARAREATEQTVLKQVLADLVSKANRYLTAVATEIFDLATELNEATLPLEKFIESMDRG
jgi:hypothetical protein